jgi:GT2 family glycosyltransferase
MNPLITIQILNWNRAEDTQRAIASAIEQTYNNFEIIVIDNGSTDNSIELTKRNFPDIKIIPLDKNYGCPGGRNLGIKHCNGDYIFYLDNDGVLHKNAVENAYNTIKKTHECGVLTGIVYDFNSISEIDANCSIKSRASYEVNLFQGGICMHKKEIYNNVGYYPDHFMYGAEETFLSLKLFDSKYKIIKDESVILWHKQSDKARDKSREILYGYYNRLYIAITLYPFKEMIIFIAYFIIKYPSHAKKSGVLKKFIKQFPANFSKTVFKGFKNRKPVSNKAYLNYKKDFFLKK